MHRVVIDLDKQSVRRRGLPGRGRDPAQRAGPRRRGRRRSARSRGARTRCANCRSDALRGGRSRGGDEARDRARRASHRGSHVRARRPTRITGDATRQGLGRASCATDKGIKFKEIWVQHRDDSVDQGPGRDLLLPDRLARRRRSIELTDGSEVFSVLVYGLTGRVELRDGALRRRQRPHAAQRDGRQGREAGGRHDDDATPRRAASRCSR